MPLFIRITVAAIQSGISVGLFPFETGRTKQDYEELALSGGYEAVIVADRAALEKAGLV